MDDERTDFDSRAVSGPNGVCLAEVGLSEVVEAVSVSDAPLGDGEDRGLPFIRAFAVRLHDDIRDHSGYREACERAHVCRPQRDKPRHYQLLAETAQVRVGILTLFRFSPICMHDHKGSHGAQLVLHGRSRMRQYDYVSDDERERRLVMLERRADRVIDKGDWVCYTPSQLNIHEFDVLSPRFVLFSVVFRPPAESSRSWFFSTDPFDSNGKRLYTRVKIGGPKRPSAPMEQP